MRFRIPFSRPHEWARSYYKTGGSLIPAKSKLLTKMGVKPKMYADEYQNRASALAIYPQERSIEYVALGLASEAGEVAGKVKKAIRDGKNWTGEQREEHRRAILAELGDVMWYVAELARNYNLSLNEVMHHNIAKLESRQQRGKLQGSGDNR